jgi:AraC-like DNA-binding protein
VLASGDTHLFLFYQRSAICIIKFNEAFLTKALEDDECKWVLSSFQSSGVKKAIQNKDLSRLMELIVKLHREGDPGKTLAIRQALLLVLTLAAGEGEGLPAVQDDKIQEILKYIDRHITDKPMLAIGHIADAFQISPTYFNQYFKRMTGSSYKKYVQEYALQLISRQLAAYAATGAAAGRYNR